jgi:hypothetical protein
MYLSNGKIHVKNLKYYFEHIFYNVLSDIFKNSKYILCNNLLTIGGG